MDSIAGPVAHSATQLLLKASAAEGSQVRILVSRHKRSSARMAFYYLKDMEFYTYILQSESSGSLYIGSTNNLEDRLLRHNSDQNTYTKGKGPWSLLFSVTFSTRSEAVQLERFLKSKKSKPRVLAWIASKPRYRIPPRSFY